jgi:Do/DeqQ family serine protease
MKLSIVLVIGFLLGGAVVAKNTGTSFLPALLGNKQGDTSQAATQNNTAVSAIVGTAGVADMVEKAGPAVVNIESQIPVNSGYNNSYFNDPFFRQFFGNRIQAQPQQQYEEGICTGFIISSDGYIVTNQHVIENASSIKVTLSGKSEGISARVVGQDSGLDLAVLKIDGSGYPTVPLGNSDNMRVGDAVVAIGEPYGLDHTVTTGVVSAKGRPITIEDRNYKNLIQTDAAINPGNSGGPLLNMNGQVIAINTAVNSEAQGIGFAIPINTAKSVLNDLMKGIKITRAYMGIRMTDVDQNVIDQLQLPSGTKGVVVVDVINNGPAAQAGLKNYDVIVKLDGKLVTSASEVQTQVENKKVGNRMKVEVIRQGEHLTIPVVLQAKPE